MEDKKIKSNLTVDEIKELICDCYCKYTCDCEEEELEEVCKRCPINIL